MSKSTFDITANARHLASTFMDVADADGVVDEDSYSAWLAQLDEVCGDIKRKMQALRAVRARLLSEGDTLKAEGKRIQARGKQRERDAERLRGYMKELLIAHREVNPGVNKIETDDGFVRLNKKTSYEITVTDWVAVGEDYFIFAEPKLNKSAIVSAHKDGLEVEGVTVTETANEHVMEGGG